MGIACVGGSFGLSFNLSPLAAPVVGMLLSYVGVVQAKVVVFYRY